MIVVQLIGGLGNQLFQYAVGRMLAIRRNVPLKLDITQFETYKLHKYSLFNYHIVEEFATNDELEALKRAYLRESPQLPYYQRSVINEPHFPYAADILKAPANTWLRGHWQTEKYFSNIASVIREDLAIKSELSEEDLKVNHQIESVNSVSLHVRRCDYVSDAKAHYLIGVCSLEYYQNAINLLSSKVANPHFFVFSDDTEWVAENLQIGYPVTYVAHNGPDRNFADQWLMSQCQHNIIANSSFSWWGAWLNANPSKVVITPKPWMSDPATDTRDLVPDTWYKLPRHPSEAVEESVNLDNAAAQLSDNTPKARVLDPKRFMDSVITLIKEGTLDAEQLLEYGENMIAANQADKCVLFYQVWLSKTRSPLKYLVYFNLGTMLQRTGDYSGAEQAYHQALNIKPDYHEARHALDQLIKNPV